MIWSSSMPTISIIDAFADLPDPRLDRTRLHSLSDVIVLTLCGVLCGVDNWVDLERFCRAKLKWFRTFLELPNGRPGAIITTTCHHLSDEFGVSISGTLGSASNLGGGEGDIRVEFERDARETLDTPVPDGPGSAVEDMVRVLRDGASPLVPGEEGIRCVRLAEDIYRAAGVR